MTQPRGPDGRFVPKPWPLDKDGKPKPEALEEGDPIAVHHREEKPYSKEAKEARRTTPPDEVGQQDPETGHFNGGVPGNKGNTQSVGRIPFELRERLRRSAAERIDALEEIASDPEIHPRHRIQAIDTLLKYGLGTANNLEVAGRVEHVDVDAGAARRKLEQMLNRLAAAKEKENQIRLEESMPAKLAPVEPSDGSEGPNVDSSDEVIATFYDGGLPRQEQEPPETVEAELDDPEESDRPPRGGRIPGSAVAAVNE